LLAFPGLSETCSFTQTLRSLGYYDGVGLGVDRYMKRCYKYFTRQKEIESKDMKVMEMATFIPMKEGLKGEWSAMPTNSEAISHDTYLYF
jgi:hypothetical protein